MAGVLQVVLRVCVAGGSGGSVAGGSGGSVAGSVAGGSGGSVAGVSSGSVAGESGGCCEECCWWSDAVRYTSAIHPRAHLF